jgi:glutamine amidotransferase
MIKVGIVDYGLGNNLSICSAIEYLGYNYEFTSLKEKLDDCNIIILPGVGSFPKGMRNLKERGLVNYIQNNCNEKKIIGICLGMQLLFSNSDEFGLTKGLSLVPGNVIKFDNSNHRIPNIGWRPIHFKDKELLINEYFYFVHSFHVIPKSDSIISSTSNFFDFEFVSSINYKNIYGFQFHPEKSSKQGLKLLDNTIKK